MKKILVPVDFSHSAALALGFAARLSGAMQLQLSVIYVFNSMIASNRPDTPAERQDEMKYLREELERFTSEHAQSAVSFPPPETIVAEGVPPLHIQYLSLQSDVVLIVMGGVGTDSEGQRDFFGGIAKVVSRQGGCPIILIPANFSERQMAEMTSLLRGVEHPTPSDVCSD